LTVIHVTHFQRRSEHGEFSLERLYEGIRRHLPSDIAVRISSNRFLSRGLSSRLIDAVRAKSRQSDVNHVTGDAHYLTYFLDPKRTILTVHDFVSLERLRGVRRWLLWFFWYWLPEKRCTAIIVISESTCRQALKHLKCDPEKIVVIHNNVLPEFRPSPRRFNSERPRLLQVGTKANKNLERVTAALDGLSCELSIIGPLSDRQKAELRRHGIRFENHVSVSDEEVVRQYERCDMLVFASTYEGFGLPIVEANAVGRPVVTSNVSSMPEVAGQSACLVDPFDVGSIRDGILRVITDEQYREMLVRQGFENARRFSVEATAERYAAVYRGVFARCGSRVRGRKQRKNEAGRLAGDTHVETSG